MPVAIKLPISKSGEQSVSEVITKTGNSIWIIYIYTHAICKITIGIARQPRCKTTGSPVQIYQSEHELVLHPCLFSNSVVVRIGECEALLLTFLSRVSDWLYTVYGYINAIYLPFLQ